MIQNTIYTLSQLFVSPGDFFKYSHCGPTARIGGALLNDMTFSGNGNSTAVCTQHYADFASLLSLRSTLKSDLLAAKTTYNGLLSSVRSANSSTSTSTVYFANKRTVKELATKFNMEHSLNSAEISVLKGIAQICFKDGGLPVLDARALVLSLTGEFITDASNCSSLAQSMDRTSGTIASKSFTFSVSPNPVHSEISGVIEIVVSGQSKEEQTFELLDASGKLIRTIKTTEANSKVTMNIRELEGGVYFLKAIGESIAPAKIIVIK